jgi:hypothetical protein
MIMERIFATSGDWALGSDGIQWILYRRWRNGWRGVSFVRSERNILARCMQEKGADNDTARLLLSGLPDTFNEWKRTADAARATVAAQADCPPLMEPCHEQAPR